MNKTNLKENKVHGDFILPFVTYPSEFLYGRSGCIMTHWHEEIEILFMKKGKIQCKIDLNSYILEEDDILIIAPSALHSLFPTDNKYCSWDAIVFNLNMLNSSITDGCLIKYFAPILNNEHQIPALIKKDTKGYSEISNSIKEILNCFNSKNTAFELRLKSQLFYLFSLLYENKLVIKKKDANLTNETTKKIKIILNYIHENYMNQLLMKDIASICHFSEYYFMKFFKKHIGMTCTEYINAYRLDIACNLLNTTDKPVTEISLETGFNSVSYFNKLFKEKFKVTPKVFKKMN